MPTIHTTPVTASDRLLDVLSRYDQVMIVMHDNPDPDAIASGWAVQCLVEEKLGVPARLLGGGAIVRAENRHMVDLLGAPIQLVLNVEADEGMGGILVDCGPGAANQLLTRSGLHPVAVIDHHQNGHRVTDLPFVDHRPDVAASASIAASYLSEQGVEPGAKLATALLYAIRTETRGSETRYSPLDHEILVWLTERSDPELLACIENAPLARDWYTDLVHAIRATQVYADAAISLLPSAHGPEIVGEMADLLVRCAGMNRVLCAAVVGDDLLISARTSPQGGDATRLLQQTLDGLGSCGGHRRRSGGKISGAARSGALEPSIQQQLQARWLDVCGVCGQSAAPLVLADPGPSTAADDGGRQEFKED